MSNTRIKNKRKKWNYSTAKQRKRNKELCNNYPFLIPRSYSGKVAWYMKPKDKKYAYTEVTQFPRGWWKSFGLMLCEELRQELLKYDYLNKFRFEQVKEKYGQLTIYTNPVPVDCKTDEIIDKYTHLSENICIVCGKPDVPMVNNGWISPECFDCYRKRIQKNAKWFKHVPPSDEALRAEYSKLTNPDDCKMSDSYTVIRYSKDGNEKITTDISETANAIREKWRKMNGN